MPPEREGEDEKKVNIGERGGREEGRMGILGFCWGWKGRKEMKRVVGESW